MVGLIVQDKKNLGERWTDGGLAGRKDMVKNWFKRKEKVGRRSKKTPRLLEWMAAVTVAIDIVFIVVVVAMEGITISLKIVGMVVIEKRVVN